MALLPSTVLRGLLAGALLLPLLQAKAQPPTSASAPETVLVGHAVPEPYTGERYQPTWDRNPFLIPVPKGPVEVHSFSEDWELRGVFERAGVSTVLLVSKKSPDCFKRVTATPDAEGFRLIKASPSRNRGEVKVEVAKGTEKAIFSFPDQKQVSRCGVTKKPPLVKPVEKDPQSGSNPLDRRRRVLIPSPVPPPPGNS